MGAGACSKCCSTGGGGKGDVNTVKGRPRVVYRDLHDLDVVLIRSSVGGTKVSHPIDLRVSSSIKFYNANYYMPPTNTFEKWDRIGFLQLPSAAIQPQHYSLDNLEVTEATETMVTTRTLRQVFESGAAEIAIRVLLLDGDANDETRANSSAAAGMSGVAGGALAAAGAGLGLATSRVDAVTDQQKKRREEEMVRRAEGVMARFYEFVPQLIRCPYAQAIEVVKPMLTFVRAQLDEFKVTDQQVQYMSNLLERYDRDNSGIEFDDLVSVFKELAKLNTSIQHPMNTLNSSEIFQLASSFAVSHTNKITRNDFMSAWKSSLERTTRSRKEPRTRAIVSGAFFSLCLQRIGLLDEAPTAFYLPMNYADRPGAQPVRLKGARLGPELAVPLPVPEGDDEKRP